ncbi:MAG: mannosyltransferase family protein [Mycobacteriales bacterium]
MQSTEAPAAAGTASGTRGSGLRYCLGVFGIAVTVWVLLGVIGVGLVPSGRVVSVPGLIAAPLSGGWHNAFTSGYRQDALWYLRIAERGYRAGDGSAAFFPLYPLLIRLVSYLPGLAPLAAAIAIAWISYFAALVVSFRLAQRELGTSLARSAIALMAAFPTAFFYLAPYTEGLFLALSVGSFASARRGRWLGAGVLGMLAATTRAVGVLLALGLAVEAWLQWREGRRQLLRPALAVAGAPVGLALYFGYWWIRFGDLFAPWQAQRNWQRVATLPWLTIWHAIWFAYRYGSYWLIDALVVGVMVVAVAVGLKLLRASYSVYALASLLLPLCDPFPDRPLLSMPRFVVVVFPGFWAMAAALHRWRAPTTALLAPFSAGFALLGLLFINWLPVF